MTLGGFRQAFALNDAANASFIDNQTSGLSAGGYTQPFEIVPFKKPRCLGAIFKVAATLTSTAPETPVTGSDALDLVLSGGGDIEVSAETGGQLRCQSITRAFAEFIWAVTTNQALGVAANHTFASASTFSVTIYLFVPLGMDAASVKLKLAGNITAAYTTGVTIVYTSVKCYVVSTNYTGTVAFMQENTASLATNAVNMMSYIPKTVAPDAIFMDGETSTTITQATLVTVSGMVLLQTTDTDINQQSWAAGAIADISGQTYTTTAGFVIAGNGEAFRTFQLWFSSATTHYIGYLQIQGGEPTASTPTAQPTQATPAVSLQGAVTPSGGVRAVSPGGSGAGTGLKIGTGGSAGQIISHRT